MLISSFRSFQYKRIVALVKEVLEECNAPYKFSEDKTRYGSRAGANWNLDLMLNDENHITVGHQNENRFIAMLKNYAIDKKHGTNWPLEDVQHLAGLLSYYEPVDEDRYAIMLDRLSYKFGVNIRQSIKDDIANIRRESQDEMKEESIINLPEHEIALIRELVRCGIDKEMTLDIMDLLDTPEQQKQMLQILRRTGPLTEQQILKQVQEMK